MAKRKQPNLTQYQVKTEAPTAFIKAVPLFQWRQPWSTPPTQMGPQSRQWGAARIAGTGVTEAPTAFIKAVPLFQWRQPWSTPPTQIGPKGRQVRADLIAASGLSGPVFTPPNVVVTSIDWFTPLSTPVPAKRGLHPSLHDVSADVYSTTGVVTVDKWLNGLDVPNRAKQRAIADYAFAPLAVSEVVTIDKWFNPAADPIRTKRGLATYEQQVTAFTPENFPSCGFVGVDTEGTALVGSSSVTTIDYTGISVGGGSNRALVAMVGTSTNTTGMAAIWDQGGTNQTMTLIGSATGSGQTVALFGLRNPTSGNKTLRFSWTTAGIPTVSAVSLITVDQSSDASAFKNYQSHIGIGASSASVTVPSKVGDLVVGCATAAGGPTVTAVGDNSIYIDNTSTGVFSGAGSNAGAASVIFTATSSSASTITLAAIDVSAFPCPVSTDFILPLSEVPRRKVALHPSLQDVTTEVYLTTEVVTVDKWFEAFQDPVRKIRAAQKVNLFPFTASAVVAAETVTVDKWFVSFTNPVRIKPQLATSSQQSLAFVGAAPFAETVTESRWHQAWSEPVRVKTGLGSAAQTALFAPSTTEVITVDKWLQPFSRPIWSRISAASQQAAFAPITVTETVTPDKWFESFTDPLRKGRIAKATVSAFVSSATSEEITADKWFIPLSEPVRQKAGLPTAQQQALAFVYPVAVVATTDIRWFAPLSEPVRTKASLRTASQQALAFVKAAPFGEVITNNWLAPLSEPTRLIRAAQKVNFFPFTASAVVVAEVVTVDKWFKSFTEPVRVKPQLATGLQQAIAYVEAAPFAETVTESRWHQPWSEPLRSKPGLSAANQTAFFAPSTVIAAAEIITVDKWFEQLSDPTRRKPEDRDHYKAENEFTAIAASMKWYAPLTEPVRQKRGLAVANQTAFFAYPALIATEIITVDKWFKSFADPICPEHPADDRYAGENNWEAIAASMEWFAPFTEPVRSKPGLVPATRPPFFASPAVIIIPSLASWWQPLSDPPKAKAGLKVANQRFDTRSTVFIPNPNQFLEGWYNWFSEPVRKLAQLNVALQKAWFGPDRNAVQATVTATMAVTEVNGDIAIFAIKVFAGNPPATAVVSLVEIGHGASLTSIVEEGDDGSGTSIVET